MNTMANREIVRMLPSGFSEGRISQPNSLKETENVPLSFILANLRLASVYCAHKLIAVISSTFNRCHLNQLNRLISCHSHFKLQKSLSTCYLVETSRGALTFDGATL